MLRIYWNNRKAKADTVIDEKDAEIARLRALVEQQNGGGAPAEAAFAPMEYGESAPAEAQVFAEGAEGQALAEGASAEYTVSAEGVPENVPEDAALHAGEMAAEEMAAYGDPADGYAAFEGAEDAGQPGAEEAPAEDMPAQEQSGEDKPGGEDAPLEEEER